MRVEAADVALVFHVQGADLVVDVVGGDYEGGAGVCGEAGERGAVFVEVYVRALDAGGGVVHDDCVVAAGGEQERAVEAVGEAGDGLLMEAVETGCGEGGHHGGGELRAGGGGGGGGGLGLVVGHGGVRERGRMVI